MRRRTGSPGIGSDVGHEVLLRCGQSGRCLVPSPCGTAAEVSGSQQIRGSAKKARLVQCEENVVTLLVQQLAVEAG